MYIRFWVATYFIQRMWDTTWKLLFSIQMQDNRRKYLEKPNETEKIWNILISETFHIELEIKNYNLMFEVLFSLKIMMRKHQRFSVLSDFFLCGILSAMWIVEKFRMFFLLFENCYNGIIVISTTTLVWIRCVRWWEKYVE